MPLSALTEYGRELIRNGTLPQDGFCRTGAKAALVINQDGDLIEIRDLKIDGKAAAVNVPFRGKHTVTITPFGYADTAAYLLGLAVGKGKEGNSVIGFNSQTEDKFKASKEFHVSLLENAKSTKAKALRRFFIKWTPEANAANSLIADAERELGLSQITVIAFILAEDNTFVHDDDEMKEIWIRHIANEKEGCERGTCLITGEKNVPIRQIHPAILRAPGMQSSGVSLVSFNKDPVFYYTGEPRKAYNAPCSTESVELYSKALQYLIDNKAHHLKIGPVLYVFWADADISDRDAQLFLSTVSAKFFDSADDETMSHMVNAIRNGSFAAEQFAEEMGKTFHVIGLRSHSARLAIVSYETGTMGTFVQNIQQHYRRSLIYKAGKDPGCIASGVSDITYELTDNAGNPPPATFQETMVSCINNGKLYPDALLYLILRRIGCDGNVTAGRVSALKAYLIKNKGMNVKMALDKENKDVPYLLGRYVFFSERLQEAALERTLACGIHKTYFPGMMKQPVLKFPSLAVKNESYVNKLLRKSESKGLGLFYQKSLAEIADALPPVLPRFAFSPAEQGEFIMGYYNQRENFYTKKENK